MKRRQAVKLIAAAIGTLAAGWGRCCGTLAQTPAWQAVRGRLFPGRVHPLRDSDIDAPGPWLG